MRHPHPDRKRDPTSPAKAWEVEECMSSPTRFQPRQRLLHRGGKIGALCG